MKSFVLLLLLAALAGSAHACGVTTASYNSTSFLAAVNVSYSHTCDDFGTDSQHLSAINTVTTAAGQYAYVYASLLKGDSTASCSAVMKFNAGGTLLWTSAFRYETSAASGHNPSTSNTLFLDNNEDIFVTTVDAGSMWIDRRNPPVMFNTRGNTTRVMSVLKFNASTGVLIWSQFLPNATIIPRNGDSSARGRADPYTKTDIVIMATISNALNSNLNLSGTRDVGLWRLRSSDGTIVGVYQWNHTPAGSLAASTAMTQALAIDPTDGSCIVGVQTVSAAGNYYAHVSKSTCGAGVGAPSPNSVLQVTFLWENIYGPAANWITVEAVGVDACGAVYANGNTEINFLNVTIPSASNPTGFVLKFNSSNGNPIWSQGYGYDASVTLVQSDMQVLPWGTIITSNKGLQFFGNQSFLTTPSVTTPSVIATWDTAGTAGAAYGRNGTNVPPWLLQPLYASPVLASVIQQTQFGLTTYIDFSLDLIPLCRPLSLVADPLTQAVVGLGTMAACETGCTLQLPITSDVVNSCPVDQFCGATGTCNTTAGCTTCNTSSTCAFCNQTAACPFCNITKGCSFCNTSSACSFCNTSSTCAFCNTTAGCAAAAATTTVCPPWSWSFNDAFNSTSAIGFVLGMFLGGLLVGSMLMLFAIIKCHVLKRQPRTREPAGTTRWERGKQIRMSRIPEGDF